jgi:hypothetical protein
MVLGWDAFRRSSPNLSSRPGPSAPFGMRLCTEWRDGRLSVTCARLAVVGASGQRHTPIVSSTFANVR